MMKVSLFLIFAALSSFASCQSAGQKSEYKKFASDADVPRIEVADAKKVYDAGAVVTVDSRPESAYKVEHIKGAINIPIGAPDDAFSVLPKDKSIIVYCS